MIGITRDYTTYEKKQENAIKIDVTHLFDLGDWDNSDVSAGTFFRVSLISNVALDKEMYERTNLPRKYHVEKIENNQCTTDSLVEFGGFYFTCRTTTCFCNYVEATRLHARYRYMRQFVANTSYIILAIIPVN